MKKIIVLLLTVVLLTVPFSISVAAAKTPTFVIDSIAGNAGDTVKVNISVQNNPGIISMKLLLNYNTSALEIVKVESGNFKSIAFGDEKNNPLVMNWVEPLKPNNSTNGIVASVTFKILDTAASGKSELSLTYNPNDVFESNFENVTFAVENGFIDITGSSSNATTSSQNGSTSSNPSSGESSVISNTATNSTEQSSDQNNNNNNDNNGNNSQDWINWVVGGAVFLLIVAFAVVIIKSKK